MNVKITADSTCDLPRSLIEQYAITITPLTVTLGQRQYQDGVDLDPNDIFPFVESAGTLPKTSAVNIEEYARVFRQWVQQGYEVVHISLCSEFSSTCQNAVLAADEVGHTTVVDSRNLSSGQGLIVLRAAELAQQGADAAAIVSECKSMISRVETSFVIDTLEYLYKGGRCSALAAFGANLLKIKPCIAVNDGRMLPEKKYRGNIEKVISMYIDDRLKGREDIDLSRVILTHTNCTQACVEQTRQQILRLLPDVGELIEAVAGSTISTHCGPNALGVLFVRKA